MGEQRKTTAKIRKADEKFSKSKTGGWDLMKLLGLKDGSLASSGMLWNIFKVIGVIFVAVFAYVAFKQSQSAIRNLINADEATLKDVIFGEMPHVFLCDRGNNNVKGSPSPVPAIFSELNLQRGSKTGFAILNCSQVLPSGKSIWDRFKLKKEWKPTIWGTAPWSKPLQAGPTHMKDINTMKKFVDEALAPKATEVKSEKQLVKFCGFDKNQVKDPDDFTETCFLLSKGTRFAKSHTELEHRLIMAYPKTKFAWADATKLRLSFEDVDDLPADAYALKMHALKNGTHYLSMVNPITWDYMNTFVSQALASGLSDFQGDKKQLVKLSSPYKPKPRTKKPPVKKTTQPPNNGGFDSEEDSSKKPDKAERAERREKARAQQKENKAKEQEELGATEKTEEEETAARAEQIRRERMIRDQMDKLEREYLFEEAVEEGEAEEGSVEEEEDDNVIEL